MPAMEVAPRTLREVEFREKLRGYNQDDVDEFLERVAAGIEVLQDRLRQATERVKLAEQKAAELPADEDDTLRRTLVLAQRTADMAVKEAQERSAEILGNAQAEARALVAEAEEQARRVTSEAERSVRAELSRLEEVRSQLQADAEALQHHVDTERNRAQAAFSNALRWVEENLPPGPKSPPLHQVNIPPASAPMAAPRPSDPEPSHLDASAGATPGIVRIGGDDDLPPGSVFDADALEGVSRSTPYQSRPPQQD
jgi:cell division initiation protein